MVTITEPAGALLHRMQAEKPLPETLRIITESDEFVVGTTPPSPDDEVLFYEGAPVLRLSTQASAALAGCTIVTRDTPEGTVLSIVAPDGSTT